MQNLPGQIDAILGVLAERFGTTVAHIWAVFVRQQVVSSIAELFVVLVAFPVLILGAWSIATRIWRRNYGGDSGWLSATQAAIDNGDAGPGVLVGLSIGLAIVGIILLCDSVLHLLNPEYYAIKAILRVIAR